jgi:hypothetical protein
VSGRPPLSQLRAAAAACGVDASDADLARAREYLSDLLPGFAELELLVAEDTMRVEPPPSPQR